MGIALTVVISLAIALVVAGYLADKFIDETDDWGNHDW